jgi:NADH-quinone oxidoreductase subunit A
MLDYLPVLMQILVATGFAASMLIMSVAFGKIGRRGGVRDDPYECGMLPIGEGVPRFSVKFYLVAMLFLIFDIEVVCMYPWAVQYKELIVTNAMVLLSMASFMAILGMAYLYVLQKGALNWKA